MSVWRTLKKIIRQLHTANRIPAQRHEVRPVVLEKPIIAPIDESATLYRRRGYAALSVTVKEGVATFTPMRSNPDRVNLYTDGTHDALKVFYYRSKNQNVYISKGSSFIMIHESVLTGIQQAFKKYQRRKFDVPKPRPSGVDYPPPPERKESRRGRR